MLYPPPPRRKCRFTSFWANERVLLVRRSPAQLRKAKYQRGAKVHHQPQRSLLVRQNSNSRLALFPLLKTFHHSYDRPSFHLSLLLKKRGTLLAGPNRFVASFVDASDLQHLAIQVSGFSRYPIRPTPHNVDRAPTTRSSITRSVENS